MENRHLLVVVHTVLGALVVDFFGCWVTCSPCHCVQVERGAEILHSVLFHYMSWRDDLLPQHLKLPDLHRDYYTMMSACCTDKLTGNTYQRSMPLASYAEIVAHTRLTPSVLA